MARRANVWLLLAVALAGVVSCALSPSRAHAACGDYVLVGNPAHAKTHTSSPAKPATAPIGDRPCSGPNCSGRPVQLPPTPAPAPPTSGCDQWVWVGGDGAAAEPGLRGRLRDTVSLRSVLAPFRIDRPPRFHHV